MERNGQEARSLEVRASVMFTRLCYVHPSGMGGHSGPQRESSGATLRGGEMEFPWMSADSAYVEALSL